MPDLNLIAADQVGWPTYAAQVRAAHASLREEERAGAVAGTSNYGEAGAVDRYAPTLAVYSGQTRSATGPARRTAQ